MAQSLKQQFVEWVGKQPRERGYFYLACSYCAFAQFLIEHEMAQNPLVGGIDWFDADDPSPRHRHPIPEELIYPLESGPHTFGALADRLSAAS